MTSSRDVRKRINYLSHYNAIAEEMTVYNALTFYANMQGGSADEVLALLHLQELRDTKVSDLSQGQKKESLSCEGVPKGERPLLNGRAHVKPGPRLLEGDQEISS